MAELADALDSGSSESNFMQVQVLFPAPSSGRAIVRIFCISIHDGNQKGRMRMHADRRTIKEILTISVCTLVAADAGDENGV